MQPNPKILIILHQATSTPGRIGKALIERGYDLDIRRPPLGHVLPETLNDHAGAVMFGGPMSANDDDEFVAREIDWIGVPLKENKPFMGICLGAQKLVRHLGGEVWLHPEEFVEIGYYPIAPTPAGADFIDWPNMVFQWHREGFDLPSGAELLASGDTFPNQAFRYGENAYAIQFHVELTLAMMHKWGVKGAHRMEMPGAQPKAEHLRQRLLYDAATKIWIDGFLDRFLMQPQAARSAA
ncbi:MAG: glutamine amidotransferase [Pseudomonadota bacterium]